MWQKTTELCWRNTLTVNGTLLEEYIVLALLYYNCWNERHGDVTVVRTWKSLDWDALGRLYENGLISNPKGKAKSVCITENGYNLAKGFFEKHFGCP
jgi:hypothetical protein